MRRRARLSRAQLARRADLPAPIRPVPRALVHHRQWARQPREMICAPYIYARAIRCEPFVFDRLLLQVFGSEPFG